MRQFILILSFLIAVNHLIAQTETPTASKFKCKIGLINNKEEIEGELYQLNDSSIVFKKAERINATTHKLEFELMSFPVTSIEYISIKRKGAEGRGFLIGAGVGAMLVGLIAYADGDDHSTEPFAFNLTAEEKATAGAVVGLIPGGLIGLAIGSSTKTVIGIHGKYEIYKIRKVELAPFAIIK